MSEGVRRGAVGVIVRAGRVLVIRRAAGVAAPGAYCFPGGAIEAGESEAAALVRELEEELSVTVRPVGRLWESTTAWGVWLAWWQAELCVDHEPVPNPSEVASYDWHTLEEMTALPELLESNREFLAAVARGEIRVAGLGE